MVSVDIEKLKKLAQEAPRDRIRALFFGEEDLSTIVTTSEDELAAMYDVEQQHLRYIAATTPAVVLELIAEIERLEKTWRCYRCSFETASKEEAEAHFGDSDGEPAICVWWYSELEDAERLRAYQDLQEQLNGERDIYTAEAEERSPSKKKRLNS